MFILGCISTMQTFAWDDSDHSDYPSISSDDLAVHFYAKKELNSDFEKKEEEVIESSIYQEDKDDQDWMDSLEEYPLFLIDARAVGRPVDIKNIDQRQYTRAIRHGRYSDVNYKKYRDVIVNLSDQELKIINFALAAVFKKPEYIAAYTSDQPVTFESLLNLASNIKYTRNLDEVDRYVVMRILNQYLYY